MNENIAWEYVSQISIGTIVSWIIFIGIIVGGISTCVIKLYKIFDKSKDIQEENDHFKELVKKHDETLNVLKTEIESIRQEQLESKDRELKKFRHSIVSAGETYLEKQCISIRSLKSLEEMYSTYQTFIDENGKPANGYVRTLMDKVRSLRVVGKLDENDEDILD